MSNRKNINWEDFVLLPEHCEDYTGQESMTVPDETLTIRQIVDKHIRGQEIADELMRTPVNIDDQDFDDEDLEKVEQMDLADRENLKLLLQNSNEEKKKTLKSFFENQKNQKNLDVEDVEEDDHESGEVRQKPVGKSHAQTKGVTKKEERSDDDQGATEKGLKNRQKK